MGAIGLNHQSPGTALKLLFNKQRRVHTTCYRGTQSQPQNPTPTNITIISDPTQTTINIIKEAYAWPKPKTNKQKDDGGMWSLQVTSSTKQAVWQCQLLGSGISKNQTHSSMEDGKGTRKSNVITATPTREASTTSKKQQSKREQEVPKKLRSAMKKDLKDFFGQGKRAPGPTTAGNPIETVIQHRVLQVGTPTGKGDSGAGAGGKEDNNNSWHTPLVKKKRDKSNTTPQGAKGKEGQNNKKT